MDKFFLTCVRLTLEEESILTVFYCIKDEMSNTGSSLCSGYYIQSVYAFLLIPIMHKIFTTRGAFTDNISLLPHQVKAETSKQRHLPMQCLYYAVCPCILTSSPTMSQAVEMLNFSDSKKGAFTEWRLTVPCLGRQLILYETN